MKSRSWCDREICITKNHPISPGKESLRILTKDPQQALLSNKVMGDTVIGVCDADDLIEIVHDRSSDRLGSLQKKICIVTDSNKTITQDSVDI